MEFLEGSTRKPFLHTEIPSQLPHLKATFVEVHHMCGICGIFLLDPTAEVDRAVLERMNRTMVHRGPDDEGFYVAGSVGLAMRRLSIIDLEGGHQPITNEDESLWIVFNGEIYNYPELRSELLSKGHRFRTQSDTEVILHLYEEMGENCVTRLNGMFGFALWDSKHRRLFLARDRLGIKPLFYSYDDKRRLLFGSELKAVLAGGISREPDYQALYDYLSLMYVPTPATAFAAVRKLPPGCFLTCSPEGMKISRYWDIPLPAAGEEEPPRRDYEAEILDLVETAIRRHMIADVQVGALLSGGLDSTTVAAVMARKLNVPLKTFTIGFDRKSYDESKEARLVAATLGTEHLETTGRPAMIESIPELLNFFDEPFADYSAIPTFLVSELAARHVKVVLTGDGGDEIFAGYPTHVAYRVSRIFTMIPRWLRENLITPVVMALPTSMDRISFDYKAKRFVTGADLPLGQGHYWWKVIFSEDEKKELCSGEFLGTGFRDSFAVFERHFAAASHAHPLNQLLYVDAKTFLLDDNLTKVDRMTMAHSLEARVPLLDHELVERLAVIPPRIKSTGLQTKRLLRRAVRNLLPPAIRKGKKKGFTPPLPYWIKEELKDFILDSFSTRRLSAIGLLNPAYCRRLLDEHLQGKKDNNRQIWTVLALTYWLEKNRA
ncbi:MAG: asparagine synthase (glutamine-hydrolyzing) [Desulfomonile tiedjei]|nr:asparagine synthase (glutamine-hydrolyzing) [Desulfomonile tiedjei]